MSSISKSNSIEDDWCVLVVPTFSFCVVYCILYYKFPHFTFLSADLLIISHVILDTNVLEGARMRKLDVSAESSRYNRLE